MGVPAQSSGRLLERWCKPTPRGMIVHDRTRLIDQLDFSFYFVTALLSIFFIQQKNESIPPAEWWQSAFRFDQKSVLEPDRVRHKHYCFPPHATTNH